MRRSADPRSVLEEEAICGDHGKQLFKPTDHRAITMTVDLKIHFGAEHAQLEQAFELAWMVKGTHGEKYILHMLKASVVRVCQRAWMRGGN
jgi:hypothetical protein